MTGSSAKRIGGLYSNISIDISDCTAESEDSATADITDGIVKGIQTGTTYINVDYSGAKDIVKVIVV